MSREILLDNYTLQGAYGYLYLDRAARLYEQCLSHLIEAAVVYDTVYVPDDVLSRNPACQQVAAQFGGIVVGKSLPQTPDIHHNVVDPRIVEQFRPLLADRNPFGRVPTGAAHDIEAIGHPFSTPAGWMGRGERPLSFAERHTYYAWYCVRLASALGLNYAPNPIRGNLFKEGEFLALPIFPNFQRDLLTAFEDVRERHAASVSQVFKSLRNAFDFPLVYSYVKANAATSDDIIALTKRLRDSREAVAFRRYCVELEAAVQEGRVERFEENRKQIEALREQWSGSLGRTKATKKGSIGLGGVLPLLSFSTDFELPWLNLRAADRRPHFVFIHKLLSASYRPAAPNNSPSFP